MIFAPKDRGITAFAIKDLRLSARVSNVNVDILI